MSKIGIQTRGSGAVMRKYLAKGGRIGLPSKRKVFKTHGRDVPTMAAKGGRIGKFGGGRTDLLEELGRVEGERSNPNRRAEISRVHGELNRGLAKGGRAGFKDGGSPHTKDRARSPKQKFITGYGSQGQSRRPVREVGKGYQKGGRVGLKHGGKPWGHWT